MNYHLQKKSIFVEDLNTCFADGVTLLRLLEILSNKSLGKKLKEPKTKPEIIDNISHAIKFLEKTKPITKKRKITAEGIFKKNNDFDNIFHKQKQSSMRET